MPFRQTSTWQDHDCEIGFWEKGDELLAWGVFQPAWWNLDYAIQPSERGSILETEIFAWGVEQMMAYSRRTGEDFYGSVEFYEDTPSAERTIESLESLGFEKFDWSTIHFEIELHQEFPQPQLPDGFRIRPFGGEIEVDDYVDLHRAAFGSDKMTKAWRMRTLEHPAYRPESDLVIVSPGQKLVGFCICWTRGEISQIEPLGVHPEYQGRRLGSALELSALHTLREQGARYVYLDHVSFNEKAIALSLKTGFRQRNNALRYFVAINSMS
jgi:ribosomal protein S18 acetylase RimI-like enzyme